MCLNRNLKVSGFLRVFEGKYGELRCNALVVSVLSEQGKSSKICLQCAFLKILKGFVFD